MMDAVLQFIDSYGYWAVFLGSLVEGESVILTASALASQGILNIHYIAVIAFVGTTIADQILYFLGRKYGNRILNSSERMKNASAKAFHLLRKYDTYFIIACRFIYGVRVASAIVIGASGIPPKRFIPLNILSAAIWAIISCYGGYYLGSYMIALFEQSSHLQKNIMIAAGVLLVVGFIATTIYKIFSSPKPKDNKEG